MRATQLRSKDGALLFEGIYPTFTTCLEAAVQQGVKLDHLDLSGQDLRHANLDNAIIRWGDFTQADLSGANISEAVLDDSDFSCANMINICGCYSSFKRCLFLETAFGASDFSESIIDRATFAGPSMFSIPFARTSQMNFCLYQDESGQKHNMNHPPLVITGLKHTLILLEDIALINNKPIKKEKLESLLMRYQAQRRKKIA